MNRIEINLPEGRDYPILIGRGLIPTLGSLLEAAFRPPAAEKEPLLVVTDKNVAAHYLSTAENSLRQAGWLPVSIVLPPGEATKAFDRLQQVLDRAASIPLYRDSPLVALGGGVIGDLAGFAASIYMRGIPYIQVPTSLLAQVDSSIGGKTAINHVQGKNLIGAFHQPELVITDVSALTTLSSRHRAAGMAEVVKHALLSGENDWHWLWEHRQAIQDQVPGVLSEMLVRSCRTKAAIVIDDETEQDRRRLLNLGHTVGHALEAWSEYRWLHGEAVALGLVAVTYVSEEWYEWRGQPVDAVRRLRQDLLDRLHAFDCLPDPVEPPAVDTLTDKMQWDKKASREGLVWVIPYQPGQVTVQADLEEKLAIRGLERFLTDWRDDRWWLSKTRQAKR